MNNTSSSPVNGSMNLNTTSGIVDVGKDVTSTVIVISIIITVGIIGNSMVIVVVGCISSMRTTTNFLLVNVAASDIISLLLTAIHVGLSRAGHAHMDSSAVYCKVISPNTLCNAALLATGLTLTVLSVERYNALVKPMKISRRLTKHNVGYVIIGIWVVSMVMALPMLVYLNIDPDTGQCTPGDYKENLYISLTIIVVFITIAPFLVIAFCYFQIISGLYFTNTICNASTPGQRDDLADKKKLVKLLLLLTVLYFIAFVPTGVALILKFRSILDTTRDAHKLSSIRQLARVTVYLMPLHSAINPFLYAFPSQNYREGFVVVLKKVFRCKRTYVNGGVNGNSLHPAAAADAVI